MIDEAEEEKTSAFSISQEDIDAILVRGDGVHHGKYRIYEQYLKKESAVENAKFLKDEYGWGGSYPAIRDRDLDESHDGKGIKISRGSIGNPDAEIVLTWKRTEKRIGELIAADRYLNTAEKEKYPAYVRDQKLRERRQEVSDEFRSIVYDYNDYQEQLGEQSKKMNLYYLSGCWSAFVTGDKKMYARTSKGDFILPMMRDAMNQMISENTHLTERCEAMLISLDSDVAKPLEPTYDEANPPPEPPKKYRFSLGDTVYLGAQEYEILSLEGDMVRLFDPTFPLLNKELSREEFDRKTAENPLNDKYLQLVEPPEQVHGTMVTTQQEIEESGDLTAEFEPGEPVGRIEYLGSDGDVGESVEYTDEDKFVKDATERNHYGIPMRIVLYKDDDGNTISKDFVYDMDPPPRGLEVVDSPQLAQELPVEEEVLPPPAPKPRAKVSASVLHPEVPDSERINFTISDDALGVGTAGERYANNIAAIRLLNQLDDENRFATSGEQEVLSNYVGWGGLSDCFDERNSHYGELKALLSDDEYTAARESTLTAFYTPPTVIRAMYKALENMNFKTSNILEPSCGVGNFLGMLPESMQSSKLYGVELDDISGRIARQLYQKSNIAVQGYEKTNLPDNFFDLAVGNVPFGQFKVADKRYDKHNFLIHDYFFSKTLDKVRPGGIVAFITSKGTLDKENPAVRKYIAQRADLLGAIRLPNNTFKSAAGTEVTSDILFLQKRDRLVDIEPDWVHLNIDENGLKMNQYFIDNPDMVLGEMKEVSGPFGPESACVPYEEQALDELLSDAIQNIHAEITEYELDDIAEDEDVSIPADPSVRNFSFTIVDGSLYYRENSRMNPVDVSVTAQNRIKGMIEIRDCVRTLIEYQTEDYPDSDIEAEQQKLNTLYDAFNKKYGVINSRANSSAFSSDSSYCLLSSLEVLDDEGNFLRKADMFSKRTIKQKSMVTSVDTASEALSASLGEKAKVDLPFMAQLTGKSAEEILADLSGVVFLNSGMAETQDKTYVTADEYLSGNVREKLRQAKAAGAALADGSLEVNIKALEAVQPKDLLANEISVRLGATWLPTDVVDQFVYELFDTPRYSQFNIHVNFSQYTGEWNVAGKSYDRGNIKAYNTYGTSRINGYKIIEDTLNLKDVRIFDYIEDENGRKQAVLNKKETAIAQGKQELIKSAFSEWIWSDPARRERLCTLYNEKFNSVRPREYDGSHLNFVGINPEITLREHQVNGIAHVLYGGNTLLAHVVGAGKTFEMVAAAQESKRLGLCQKSLFVVPNHLTEQWSSEYLQLYPAANILVATKKIFEAKNRKRFCGRISTGDYDAVIIGHSQFEKIPMSIERQRAILEQQLEDVVEGLIELKRNRGDSFSVKQLERTKKSVALKLEKLNDQTRKDDLVTFEELGVDRIFVDEAHYYKNLAAFTKMRNVGGVAQTEAMKSSDLYMKCRYLDELTGGHGVVFATGTPIYYKLKL